ncbi:MAG: DUF6544 family protein [Rhodoferax sp.]|uniref:DUF6920 family protein n=1 Tax=Candidatus Aalborgicola defluviihabitans TaxID=3386187 RepID=UPI0039090357|nr:hypothetical protein [Burkholderiales bacterium]
MTIDSELPKTTSNPVLADFVVPSYTPAHPQRKWAALRWIVRGVVALAVVSLIVGLSGNARWSRNIDARMQALAAATPQTHSQRYDDEELKNLPPVVRRYLSLALNPNQPIVRGLYLEQTGSFNRSSDPQTPQWEPFTARQRVATKRPGFVWDAAITVSPGITVRVVDAYVAGVGSLQPSVLGLVDVGSSEGNTDIARGELIRYFAESVWYPTALLPSQGVQWEAVDAHSAKATLTDGPLTVSLLFAFDAVGFVERISSTERSALLNGAMVPMPWEVRLFNYAEHDGMRVPQEGKVAWLTPRGRLPYWRGTIAKLVYDMPR